MKEAECITVPNVLKDLTKLNWAETAEHLRTVQNVSMQCLYLHFPTMYVASVVYMGGEQFVKGYGMDEKQYSQMLMGFETKGLASDRGQFRLAKSALAKPDVLKVLESPYINIEDVVENVKRTKQGQDWAKEVRNYLREFGHRSIAAIMDANYPTWFEQPSIVVENVINMIPRIKTGWDFEVEMAKTVETREKTLEAFRKNLKPEDKEAFEVGIKRWQQSYQFNEDHWFYLEQMNWNSLHYAAQEVGRRFEKMGILESQDDAYFLTYEEMLDSLEMLAKQEKVATYVYTLLYKPLAKHRKKLYEKSKEHEVLPFVVVIPEKMEDPVAIKVFGITDFVLERAKREMAGESIPKENIIKGFPGAPGVVEGPARVITSHDDFARLKDGDILVCPYTSPAWTPIFLKIKGVVTDSCGMLTHAAITAREYNIPAVVGTWGATQNIKNGDIIRIDGTEGIVEILSRA